MPRIPLAESNEAITGRLMRADEVAELLGVPKSWIYEASRRGEIPTVSLGRYRRFRREAIEVGIKEQEERATA